METIEETLAWLLEKTEYEIAAEVEVAALDLRRREPREVPPGRMELLHARPRLRSYARRRRCPSRFARCQ